MLWDKSEVQSKGSETKIKVMKKITIGITLLSLFTAFHLHGQQSAKDTAKLLMGTWTMIETVHPATKKTEDLRQQPERMFVVITDTHSLYGMMDGKSMQLKKVNFGCSYTLEGAKWTERWDFGGANAGKEFVFELKIEGDKLFKTLAGGGGRPSIQVWERFKRPSQSSAGKEATSLGQQLIDLKKAKDAGAITDVEYQAQKAKLLINK